MENVKVQILKMLERYEIDATNIDTDGVKITKNLFVRILEMVRESKGYSSIRGHVKLNNCFNVSYETNYLSYERFLDEIYFQNATISYKSSENTYQLFISRHNWIDLFINYNEYADNAYATIVVVPKPSSK